MSIYGWDFLAVCHHPDKFDDHRHCDSDDLMFWICRMTSHGLMFNEFCYFTGRKSYVKSPPCHVWWPLV